MSIIDKIIKKHGSNKEPIVFIFDGIRLEFKRMNSASEIYRLRDECRIEAEKISKMPGPKLKNIWPAKNPELCMHILLLHRNYLGVGEFAISLADWCTLAEAMGPEFATLAETYMNKHNAKHLELDVESGVIEEMEKN